jgi:hypothetical protein
LLDKSVATSTKQAEVAIFSTVPLAFTGVFASPFVQFIFLRLPRYARTSKELAQRYSKSLPLDAKLEIVTMRLVPLPKTTKVLVRDLRLIDTSKNAWWNLRMENLERISNGTGRRKFWYDTSKEAGQGSRFPGLWQNVLAIIRKNTSTGTSSATTDATRGISAASARRR